MNRKLKKTGMAIAAILVMGIMATPTASAIEFHTGFVYPLSGTQTPGIFEGKEVDIEDTDTFNAGTVKCEKISYTGELKTTTSSTLVLTPSFSTCIAFSFINASVDTNGCTYVFHIAEENSTDISCPAGKSLTVTAFNCEVTIGAQSGLKTVSYSNEKVGSSRDIKISWNISGLAYTQHSKSFPGCSANETKPFTNGKKVGGLALQAGAPEPIGVWYE